MVNTTNIAGICCLAVHKILGGKVSFPGNQNYTASLGSYFSSQQAEEHPRCIVSPETTQEVSEVVRALTTLTNTTTGCQFAVRSGGHAYVAGASNIDGEVTLDLRGLSDIKVSQDWTTVLVGVGATWGAVYSRLDSLKLSVVGGRVADVGVGGLTIGGGISYFGPRYGFTCDTVTRFEVVLANGSIVHADKDENPDLLWALRGGSNNFGIVTRIELVAFTQGNLWGGLIYNEISTAEEQIAAISEFSNPAKYDEYSSLETSFAYSGAEAVSVIVNTMEYTRAITNPPAFHNLSSIPSLASTMRITNMTDLSAEAAALQANGLREGAATLTIETTVEALNATVHAWNASIPSIQNISGIVWSLNVDPIPPAIYARHAGTNALGLTGRQGKGLALVMLSFTWSESGDDDRVAAAAKALVTSVEQEVGKFGALDPYIYLNYAAQWQDPIASYGHVNVDRLTRVQKDYDPRRIFTRYVPGGFKLPQGQRP